MRIYQFSGNSPLYLAIIKTFHSLHGKTIIIKTRTFKPQEEYITEEPNARTKRTFNTS